MSDYYSEILELKEGKDFARVIKKWEILSENLKTAKQVPMVLPDLLWVSQAGVGKTHLLRLLSEYLYEKKNLMEFCGNVKYFEFMVDYCPPERPFLEIERMINEVSNAAGFRNVYKGVVSVHIDEWVGHFEEKHFISFLEYLAANSDDWLIVFDVTSEKQSEVKKLEAMLSMFFRIEKSVLKLPDTGELMRFVSARLQSYQLVLDESAKEMLFKTIEKLRGNKYFDGYKTLVMLCQDIVYEVYSAKTLVEAAVSAEDLAAFAPDGKYISRATWNAENKGKIGLLR